MHPIKREHSLGTNGGWARLGRVLMWSMRHKRAR